MSEPLSGRPWTDQEIETALDAYFQMLVWEQEGRDFFKAEVRATLRNRLPARSKKAIELKWCNISAVLEEMGLPWVTGYKPLAHYQRKLAGAVEAWLGLHPMVRQRL
jgi:hypothetical protein